MNKRYLPLAFMFGAALVTSILTYILKFSLLRFLWTLVIVLLVFYIIGCFVKKVLETFDAEIQEAQALDDEMSGSVIEKSVDDDEDYDY